MKPHTAGESGPLMEYLLKNLPDLKRSKVKQLLKFGSIRINGTVRTRHDHPLKTGDRIEFLSRQEALGENIKKALDFEIVYEDDTLIVVDKPEGLLTMGTERGNKENVYADLMEYLKLQKKGRVFIVHRLDEGTSGLLLFAKDEKTKAALQDNWKSVTKRYYAVVEGKTANQAGKIESHLIEDQYKRVYSTREGVRDAKHSVTHYRVIRQNDRYTLLDVTLDTGRKNQIRVHMKDLGHPVVGDKKYGAATNPLRRLALHAYLIEFKHPASGIRKTFESPLPALFKKLV